MWKRSLLFTIMACFFLPVLSFSNSDLGPAKLRLELENTLPDTNRVKILLALGKHYLYKPLELRSDLDSAFYFFRKAKILSETLQAEKWQDECMMLISFCHFEAREAKSGKDVYLQLMRKYQDGTDKKKEADAWFRMGYYMLLDDSTYEDKTAYLQRAIDLYTQLGEKLRPIEALKEIADVHLNQGKLDQCEAELERVVEQYQAIGYPNLHYTYDLLAVVNCLKGNLDRALYYGLEMIRSMEATGDSASAAWFYYRMASVYENLGEHEKSIDWYIKSHAKAEESDYSNCLRIVQGLVQLGKPERALSFIQSNLKKLPPLHLQEKAFAANALGLSYDALKEYVSAERYFLEMIHYEQLLNKKDAYSSWFNLDIGRFYVKQARYSAASVYLNNILNLPDGIVSLLHLKDTYQLLFKVDSAAANYLEAISHLQQYKLLNDSLFNETKSRQIEELQIQYETEKKEQDIRILQKESQLQSVKLQKVGTTRNLTFGGIALLLVVMGLLFSRYRMKQQTNRQLELQQIEINQTNRSLQKLLEEKEWLLKEIHHRVKNNLQIVMSLLNTQAMYLENEAALDAIRHSQYRIQSISLIHQKLYQSNNLALIDMSGYIQELVTFLAESSNTENRIRYQLNIGKIELDIAQALPVGLILSEAILNAIKHAFPDKQFGLIRISMKKNAEGSVALIIRDNGVGLPPDFNLQESNSLGLNLIEGLSKQLGGSCKIQNRKGLVLRVEFAGNQPDQILTKTSEIEITA